MKSEQPCCQECGTALAPARPNAPHTRFCTPVCRRSFNNRRAMRGAELYDWAMTWRYERKRFPHAMVTIVQMLRDWREEDIARRAARFSWGDVSKSSR